MICALYHIKTEGMTLDEGYIGVTTQPLHRRLADHKSAGTKFMSSTLAKHPDVQIVALVIGSEDYCLNLERSLRSKSGMGWNQLPGGCKPPVARKGRIYSDEAIEKIRERNKTLSASPEQRLRLSALHKGKAISDEHKSIISKTHKGKPKSDEWKAKMSKSMTGVPRKRISCIHCGIESIVSNIYRWHNENCRNRGVV